MQRLAMTTRGKLSSVASDIIYLAGIVDSDGCISISKMKPGLQRTKNPRYVLEINVTNTSEKLMRWLQKSLTVNTIQDQEKA